MTLLEVIVAVLIIGTAGAATMTGFAAQVRGAERTQAYLIAEFLAEDRLAAVRLLPASDLMILPDSMSEGDFSPPFDRYRWSITIRQVLNELSLYDVKINVVWDDGNLNVMTRVYTPASWSHAQ